MQGYAIEHDKPVLYKKQFVLPADYKGQRTILRFDGVYSYARLWVNGTYVREHFGGFSRWEADITSLVKPGKKNEIKLETGWMISRMRPVTRITRSEESSGMLRCMPSHRRMYPT